MNHTRETAYRPGTHPHWSTRDSFGSQIIFIVHINKFFGIVSLTHRWSLYHRKFCPVYAPPGGQPRVRSAFDRSTDRPPGHHPHRSTDGPHRSPGGPPGHRPHGTGGPLGYADLGNRTLVFKGMDRRSLGGIPGRFGIVGDSYVKFFLPNSDSGLCPTGGTGTHRENTA